MSDNNAFGADQKLEEQSIQLTEAQRRAEFLEMETERIKQDLDREAEAFKEWLIEESSIFYVWTEREIQHISVIPPPWYRNPYYPSEMVNSCVTVYKNVQMIDNSCIKSDRIDEREIFERYQKRQRYNQLKIELEKKEQELKTLGKMLKIKLGMSQKLVEMIWGKPDDGITVGEELGETWLYKGGRWVTFQDGKVEKFQDVRGTE